MGARGSSIRVHIGCGTVYLKGWINVDVRRPGVFLASERPDLVDRLITTEDNYYGRHLDKTVETLRGGPLEQEYVCDMYGDFFTIRVLFPGPVEELLTRHCFEHLSIREARVALSNIRTVMTRDGILRLDVPDHEETLKLYRHTGDPFYVRHLLGPRRDEYGFHMMSYTRDRLTKLVEEHGFKFETEEPNIHFYPAFCLRFRNTFIQRYDQ